MGRAAKEPVDARLVEADAYDRDAYRRALAGGAEAAKLLDAGRRVLPHFDALVEDLFAAFFKLVVRLRDDAPRAAVLNRRLLAAALSSPGADELRRGAALDEVRAASAALAVARAALAEIRKGELLGADELLALKRLEAAEKKAAELEGAKEALDGEASAAAERLRARLEQELDRLEAEADEAEAQVEDALEELPPGLEATVAAAADRAGQEAEGDEDAARAFAEGVGGEAPRSAAERVALAEKLRANDKLRRLAALAGAFRRDAMAARKKRVRRASSEVHRVGRGGELSRILPQELGALSDPLRKLDLLRRLAEHDLAQYELLGADRGGRGPLVVCVDASGSMAGARELWAKAVALALLEIARRQNRRAEALVFSGREQPLQRFSLLGARSAGGGRRKVSMPEVLAFAGAFRRGGPDFVRAHDVGQARGQDAVL